MPPTAHPADNPSALLQRTLLTWTRPSLRQSPPQHPGPGNQCHPPAAATGCAAARHLAGRPCCSAQLRRARRELRGSAPPQPWDAGQGGWESSAAVALRGQPQRVRALTCSGLQLRTSDWVDTQPPMSRCSGDGGGGGGGGRWQRRRRCCELHWDCSRALDGCRHTVLQATACRDLTVQGLWILEAAARTLPLQGRQTGAWALMLAAQSRGQQGEDAGGCQRSCTAGQAARGSAQVPAPPAAVAHSPGRAAAWHLISCLPHEPSKRSSCSAGHA